jgi:hypothetical protein
MIDNEEKLFYRQVVTLSFYDTGFLPKGSPISLAYLQHNKSPPYTTHHLPPILYLSELGHLLDVYLPSPEPFSHPSQVCSFSVFLGSDLPMYFYLYVSRISQNKHQTWKFSIALCRLQILTYLERMGYYKLLTLILILAHLPHTFHYFPKHMRDFQRKMV